MDFDAIPMIPSVAIYKAANVSPTRGDRKVRELEAAGIVKPVRTPTGRIVFTPPDGRRVFEAIVRAA